MKEEKLYMGEQLLTHSEFEIIMKLLINDGGT